MIVQRPQPLSANHRFADFDCGKPPLNDWLIHHARQAQGGGSARTFVVVAEEQVIGYSSLTVGQVDTVDAPDRIRKGMGQYPILVVLLARLAVDTRHQGQRIGIGLLQDAIRRALVIAEQAGGRALLTHPLDEEAARFYIQFGFIPSPVSDRQLLLLLKDARKFAVGA